MNANIKQFYKNLNNTTTLGRIVVYLRRMTSATRYWYIFLFFNGVIVVVGSLFAASLFFTTPQISSFTKPDAVQDVTINKTMLTKAINIYKMKESVFGQAEAVVPTMVDPGR